MGQSQEFRVDFQGLEFEACILVLCIQLFDYIACLALKHVSMAPKDGSLPLQGSKADELRIRNAQVLLVGYGLEAGRKYWILQLLGSPCGVIGGTLLAML